MGLDAIRSQIVVGPIAHLDWWDAFCRLGSIGEVWFRVHRLHDTTNAVRSAKLVQNVQAVFLPQHILGNWEVVSHPAVMCVTSARDFDRPGSE